MQIVIDRQYSPDQVFGALADKLFDAADVERGQREFGAHPVDGDMEIRCGVQHGAVEIDNDCPDIAKQGGICGLHTAANSRRIASITTL